MMYLHDDVYGNEYWSDGFHQHQLWCEIHPIL